MLTLVGGASRSGKTRLARLLLERRGVAYFPVDALMKGFVNGYPAFDLDPETSALLRGEMLSPILRALAVNLLEEHRYHPDYLLEGDEILPAFAVELAAAYPGQVRACFLGYVHAVPEEKLRLIRRFEPDWAEYYGDDRLVLAFLGEQVAYSRWLQQECARLDLAYFDVSQDFDGALEHAAGYLLEGNGSN